jgi:hypothetical protein
MNREEARFILTAYRSTGEDRENPDFGEALQLVENDPVLADWLAREQAMDRLLVEKLGTVPPPAGLRAAILTGGRMSRRPAWYRVAKWMSLAAALLLFSLLGNYYLRPVSVDAFAQFAIDYAERGIDLQVEGHDLAKLQDWLSQNKMPLPRDLPGRLAALEKLGCRTANYGGRDVSIICFDASGTEYHLFIAKKPAGSLLAASGQHRLTSQGAWSAAVWSDAENDYVLASDGDRKFLEHLL